MDPKQIWWKLLLFQNWHESDAVTGREMCVINIVRIVLKKNARLAACTQTEDNGPSTDRCGTMYLTIHGAKSFFVHQPNCQ